MPYVTSVERLAKEEGREEGIEKGSFIGTIRTCETILGIATSTEISLRKKSIEELTKLANELQVTVRNRFGLSEQSFETF